MAAIGLAAAVLERRDPDAVMGSFAADHVIADPAPSPSRAAAPSTRPRRLAGDARASTPTHPSTGFGYIQVGRAARRPRRGAPAVAEFVEKPAADVAEGVPRRGRLPLERRHVRGPAGRAARPARPSRTPASPPRCATIAADPARLDELWPEPAADRGRPRRGRAGRRGRPGRRRARRPRLGRPRRLRLARRAARRRRGRADACSATRSLRARPWTPRPGRARLRPGGRRRRARRRRRRRHPRRAAGHQPGARPAASRRSWPASQDGRPRRSS